MTEFSSRIFAVIEDTNHDIFEHFVYFFGLHEEYEVELNKLNTIINVSTIN